MRSRVHAENSHLCFNEVGPREEMETDETAVMECERTHLGVTASIFNI